MPLVPSKIEAESLHDWGIKPEFVFRFPYEPASCVDFLTRIVAKA